MTDLLTLQGHDIEISVTEERGAVVIRLRGELDLAGVNLLTAATSALRLSGPESLTVDLSELSFCDSQGIGCLAEIRSASMAAGLPVRLTNAQPLLRRLLVMTGEQHLLAA